MIEDIPFDDRATLAHPDWPRMAFIEGRFANDPTNWWAPNHAAVLALLRVCGMRVTARPGKETYLCVPDPGRASVIDDWDGHEYAAVTGLRQGTGNSP